MYLKQIQIRVNHTKRRHPITIIELQLDEKTIERAQRVATHRQSTLEDLLKEIIEFLAGPEPTSDPILGMFAHEPDLIDQVVQSAMDAREQNSPSVQ